MKTLLLTGNMGSGKSSFINELFMLLNAPLTGVRSVRNYEDGKLIGFDMLLIEDFYVKKTWSVARFKVDEMIINTDFKEATTFLNKMCSKKLVFIDEIGRFERNDVNYLRAVEKLAKSKNISIISLKKEDLPFNNYLIEMSNQDSDIKFFDLDKIDRTELDEVLTEISGVSPKKVKRTVFYSEEYQAEIDSRCISSDIHFQKIDNIFDMTVKFFLTERENPEIFYYYTKNLDEMKKAADIGFVVIDDLNKI